MHNINFRVVIPSLLVVVALFAAIPTVFFMRAEQDVPTAETPVASLPTKGNATTSTATEDFLAKMRSIDVSGWKTYENERYALTFQYPPEWGDVILDPSNKKNETLRCKGMVWGPRDELSIPVYDVGIRFSRFPDIFPMTVPTPYIQVLYYYPNESEFTICKSGDVVLDVYKERARFLADLAAASNESSSRQQFSSAGGIDYLYYPDMIPYESPGQFYQGFGESYGFDFEVEGHMVYQPVSDAEKEEVGGFYGECGGDTSLCSGFGKWVREGKTSVGIRDDFLRFDRVMDTFRITK